MGTRRAIPGPVGCHIPWPWLPAGSHAARRPLSSLEARHDGRWVRLGGERDLRFDVGGISLCSSGKVIRHARRADLRGLHLRRGFLAAHPLALLGLGGGLASGGLVPARMLGDWLLRGRALVAEMALLVLLVPAGLWLCVDALRRGDSLELDVVGGRWRVPLRRLASPERSQVVARARKADYEVVDHREAAP